MKTHKNLYLQIYDLNNLLLAWKKARKGKTKRKYVEKFEEDLINNLKILGNELKEQTYEPKLLVNFILRDPKTRKISKSAFRDRIIHHVLYNLIEPIFDKAFIYDCCANRIGKGTIFAIKRFDFFLGKVTKNKTSRAYCLKADIKHYFQEVDLYILLEIIKKKISDEKVIWLIRQILNNGRDKENKAMPLGNLTSQFFANVYLNELDYFIKHSLRAKYYIRYVDDFVILHESKEQLEFWRTKIDEFLKEKLRLELHSQKSRIINLSRGIDFVGFRNFYQHRLLKKRNILSMLSKIGQCKKGELSKDKLLESFQGWNAYAKWANAFKLRRKIVKRIYVSSDH